MWVSGVCSIVGMTIALVGAVIAARAVIVSESDAAELASTQWDLNKALQLAILKQSRAAAWGLGLVAVGTGFQIAGTILQIFEL